MKLSIQNGATWKGGICRAQIHAGWYHRIHQPNSNSSSWNIWTMISLIKCFTQRLEKNAKGWHILSLLYKGGWSQSSDCRKKECHDCQSQMQWAARIWCFALGEAGLKSAWEKRSSPTGLISAQVGAPPDAAPTWDAELPPKFSTVPGSPKQACGLWVVPSAPLMGLFQTNNKRASSAPCCTQKLLHLINLTEFSSPVHLQVTDHTTSKH